ncbi:YoaK family protein [Aeromicrobium sp.]|uniref:YoaK family protein n=1 Tax=Aeromicrobium sp. TaxID=1871063 RepID=UPI003519CBEE
MDRVPVDRRQIAALMALTFSTGVVDAVSYLGLDRVFTGNMTGNVVLLGLALTGAAGLSVVGASAALAGFLAGTTLGGRVVRGSTPGWNGRVTGLLTVVALVLGVLGVLLLVVEPVGRAALTTTTTTLGVAMGLQAAAARHVAVPDVSTVAVTNTLIGLGSDLSLGTGRSQRRALQATVVTLIVLGAVVGALLLRWHLAAGLGLATLVVASAAVLGRPERPAR